MFKLKKVTKQSHKIEVEAQIAETFPNFTDNDVYILIDICEHNGFYSARLLGKNFKWLPLPSHIPQDTTNKVCALKELNAQEKKLFKIALKIFDAKDLVDFFK